MPHIIVCNKTDHGAAIVSDSSQTPKTFPNKESAEAWIADNPLFADCDVMLQDEVWG